MDARVESESERVRASESVMENESQINESQISVEIAYADSSRQILLTLRVKPKTSVLKALEVSEILSRFPEIGCDSLQALEGRISIFGEMVKLKTELQNDDRIVILRPLLRDPKDARRARGKGERVAKIQERERQNIAKKNKKQKTKIK